MSKFVGLEIGGLNELSARLDNSMKVTEKAVAQRASLAAFMIQGTAQKSIQQTSAGKRQSRSSSGLKRNVTVSKPGDAPNTDTGTLVTSIRVKFSKTELAAFVFTKLTYAFWLEFGTSTMQARPFLRPALKAYIKKSQNISWNT